MSWLSKLEKTRKSVPGRGNSLTQRPRVKRESGELKEKAICPALEGVEGNVVGEVGEG